MIKQLALGVIDLIKKEMYQNQCKDRSRSHRDLKTYLFNVERQKNTM